MMQSTDETSLDINFLTMDEQKFCDVIPFLWSNDKQERAQEIEVAMKEMYELILEEPNLLPFALKKINVLRNQSPYVEFMDYFYKFGIELIKENSLQQVISANLLGNNIIVRKKRISKFFSDSDFAELQKITTFLAQKLAAPQIQQVVRKVKVKLLEDDDDDGEWNADQITYDPYLKQKEQLNILNMKRLSFFKLQKLLNDLYIFGNQKITNLSQLYLMFPDYLKVQMSIMKCLFSKKSLFNYDHQCLLAIMASSGLECKYMIHEMTEKYIMGGGEQQKIFDGYHSFPTILRKLASLYKILTSQPTKLLSMPLIINQLVTLQKTQSEKKDGEQIWTRQQVMLAIIIFAVIQCECTFQEGFGIQSEMTCTLEERISQLVQNSSPTHNHQSSHIQTQPTDFEENFDSELFMFNELPNDDTDSDPEEFNYSLHFLGQDNVVRKNDKFQEKLQDKRKSKMTTSEFNWTDNCQHIIKDFFPKLGHKLNKRYQSIWDLTQNRFIRLKTSTKEFSKAIFIFSQFILGYHDDSYDYKFINIQLPKSLQIFISKLIHKPWVIKAQDYISDFAFINILVANAKMYTQILFGLKSLDLV